MPKPSRATCPYKLSNAERRHPDGRLRNVRPVFAIRSFRPEVGLEVHHVEARAQLRRRIGNGRCLRLLSNLPSPRDGLGSLLSHGNDERQFSRIALARRDYLNATDDLIRRLRPLLCPSERPKRFEFPRPGRREIPSIPCRSTHPWRVATLVGTMSGAQPTRTL